ncbi:thiamine biosynthesis protein ThiF [Legionella sp. km535]|uniref:HesA/MoeB/ThiF family protein n=1 Tax=Legionella sp. km535 TaxID=2498107 RepID=UPI000F8F7622|nr:HesA/MoeB/ThiF family protein [Legionella sp. km535]RUR19921.1 thiamine biosynthesis protein ThiF [Legionella sp. km535]
MNIRYSRQIPIIEPEGQNKLENASVLVIGAGGVGSPLLMYLAGAGIGKLGIIDFDTVDLSNLHRQILFSENDLGVNKANQGKKRLQQFNSEIKINTYTEKLSIDNAKDIFKKYSLIIDGSDNFQTKYLANDICCQLDLPLISASIYQSQIQIVVINPSQGCYRCLFPAPPPPNLVQNCSISGVIGANAGIAGSMTASMAIQMIAHKTSEFNNIIMKINCDKYSINKLKFVKEPNCCACTKKTLSWPAISCNIELEDVDINNCLLIDLREASEDRSQRTALNYQHLPFSEFIKNPNQLPKVKLILFCSRGNRSEYAAHLLRNEGYDASSVLFDHKIKLEEK